MKSISKKVIVGVIGLTALGGVVTSAYAFGGQNLTDEQKTIMGQVRELKKSGDTEGAKKLAEDSNLPMFGKKMHKGGENHEKIEEAVKNGDYATFKELTKDAPFADKITEEMFSKIQEAQTLRQAGNFEEAKAIMSSLGINPPMGHGEFQKQDLTEDQKLVLEKAHELMKSGDKDGAKALLDDAGLKRPMKRGRNAQ